MKSEPEKPETGTLNLEPNPVRGYLLAASAAVLWGVSGVVTKFFLNRQMDPAELLIFRTSIAALLLFLWLGLRSPRLLRVSPRDLPYFALLGVIGLVANQGLYYLSLTIVSVGYALLFQYLAPIFLMIYGILTKTERSTRGKTIAACTAIGGCILMILGQHGGVARTSVAGALCGIGSALGFAFYTIYGKRGLKRYDMRTMMAYAFFFAGLMWIIIRPLWTLPWNNYNIGTLALFLYLAAVATVIPFGLFLTSLHYLEPSRSSLTSTLEPVVAATVAWLWLSEKMGPLQILGGAAVLGGIFLLNIEYLYLRKIQEKRAKEGAVRGA